MSNKERCKRWRETHYSDIKTYNKKYKVDNPDMSKESSKRYREKNREKLIMDNRQYREEHKEEIKVYAKKYREDHKDEIKEYREDHKDEIKVQQQLYYKKGLDKVVPKCKKKPKVPRHKTQDEIIAHKRKLAFDKNKEEIERIKAKWLKWLKWYYLLLFIHIALLSLRFLKKQFYKKT